MARLDRFSPPTIAEEDKRERDQAIMDDYDAAKADQDDLVAQLLEDKRWLTMLVVRLTEENRELRKHLHGK